MTEEQPVGEHRGTPRPEGPQKGLPLWLSSVVILVVLGLLIYSVVILGPEGYPVSVMLGSLIGVYAGADQLLKRRDGGDGK